MRRPRDITAARRCQNRESGQATVEFALILIPLLILVVGIIQFGIALNYWLDMNRLSNQGARFAVVNSWPTCPRTTANQLPTHTGCTETLQQYIANQLPSSRCPKVTVAFTGTGAPQTIGDPVRVTVTAPYTFRAIMKLGTITLTARTTMRIEQEAKRYAAGTFAPAGCP